MKRYVTLALTVLLAQSAMAGMTYRIETSANTGGAPTIAASVAVDGLNTRMTVTRGDGVLFLDNSVVITRDGGRTLNVFDPSSKTFYEMRPEQMGSTVSALLQQLGGSIRIENPRVAVRDLGAGETIERYPTQHKAIDSSYDIAVDAMGQQMKMSVSMSTELWTTDKFPTSAATFLQSQGLHTGIDALDKMVAAQAAAVKGFPLKAAITMKIVQNGAAVVESTSTSRVTEIKTVDLPSSTFVEPAGYTKTQNPIEKMMGTFTPK